MFAVLVLGLAAHALNAPDNPPYPSVADGLYLGSYVAIYSGLFVLPR